MKTFSTNAVEYHLAEYLIQLCSYFLILFIDKDTKYLVKNLFPRCNIFPTASSFKQNADRTIQNGHNPTSAGAFLYCVEMVAK